jgi:cathepsin H
MTAIIRSRYDCLFLLGMLLLQGGVVPLLVDATVTTEASSIPSSVAEDFDRWAARHEKTLSSFERRRRLAIYTANAALVAAHNAAFERGQTSYQMTLDGPFSDLTDDEFRQHYLMATPQNCSATTHRSSGRLRPRTGKYHDYDDDDDGIPAAGHDAALANGDDDDDDDTVVIKLRRDWRTHGIITPIKNQKHCGSCWTFSTTGCLEAHYCLQHNLDCTAWQGLAEQQLVDCAQDYNNFGCDGGLPSQAFEYIKYNGGLDLESSYPYVADQSDGLCKTSFGRVGAEVAEVFNITSYDEADLEYAVQHIGPVSIAYQVSHDFRFYQHGVYDSYNVTTNTTMCGSTPMDVNHAVVAVGLDETEDGVPFYIVRNSWGTSWGMEGYFWIKRGENLCELSDCASFPIVPTAAVAIATSLLSADDSDDDNDDDDSDVDELSSLLFSSRATSTTRDGNSFVAGTALDRRRKSLLRTTVGAVVGE